MGQESSFTRCKRERERERKRERGLYNQVVWVVNYVSYKLSPRIPVKYTERKREREREREICLINRSERETEQEREREIYA